MITYCGAEGCEHGIPFTHMAITKVRESGGCRITTVLIVCTRCQHWITKQAPECNCRAGCHSEARYELTEGFSQTVEKILKKSA